MKTTVKIIISYTVILTILIGIGFSRNFSDAYAMNQQYIEGENLALNKDYSANSGVLSSLAFDNKEHTSWKGLSRENIYLQVDLGEVKEFDTVILKERGLNIQKFKLQVSNDGIDWQDIYVQDKIEHHRLCTFAPVEGQYVRLLIEKSDRLPAIKEFEIYNVGKIEKKDDFRVTAYLSLGHVYDALMEEDITQEEANRLMHTEYYDTVTDVFFIFDIYWDEDGNIHYREGEDKYTNMLEKFKVMIGERDVNLFVTILNPHDNEKVMKSITDNRDVLIDNMIAFANKHGLDGIDLDWEFPFSQKEFDAYNSFLQELKARMVKEIKPDAQLSLALATWALRYTPETIEIIDQIQVMGYDILDQDGQHASFYGGAVQPIQYLLDQGFTKEQLNLGFPFYGTYIEGRMEQYLYKGLEEEQFNYWDNTYEIKNVGEVYFNSPAMLKDKTAYALYNDLGGVMIFSLYCDTPYENAFSLTRSLAEVLEERMD